MQLKFWKILSIALLATLPAFGQSLGDVAKENREKQRAKAASSTIKPKVITNETLPARPEADPIEIEGRMKPVTPAIPSTGRSAEQWKATSILAAKSAIAAQQAQIDDSSTILFTLLTRVCIATAFAITNATR